MSEAGPSSQKSKQKKKFWVNPANRGGSNRGRGGANRGGGGGQRNHGHGPNAGPGGRPIPAGGGPGWVSENGTRTIRHLGRYREDPPLEMMTGPGILVMAIQAKERSAEKEMILHLEDIADELYPDTSENAVGGEDGGEEGDFEDMLQKELEGMAEQNKSKRFKLCLHDTMCLFYVNVLPPLDPVRLVYHILSKIEETGQSPFKFISRMVPISAVAGATLTQLSQAAKTIVRPGFATEDDRPLKFAIQTFSRKTDRLDRLEMIRKVAEEVEALGKGHSVDLSNPDRTIVVEVYKNSIGVAVLQDFDRFKKYNPNSVAVSAAKRIHGTQDPPVAAAPTAPPTTEAEMIPEDMTAASPELKTMDPPSSTSKPPRNHNKRKISAAVANAEFEVAQNTPKRKIDQTTVDEEDIAMEEIIEDGKVFKLAKQ